MEDQQHYGILKLIVESILFKEKKYQRNWQNFLQMLPFLMNF